MGQGKELLREPLRNEIAIKETTPRQLQFHDLELKSATPEASEFRAPATDEGIRFVAYVLIEYDGMIRIQLRASSIRRQQLTHFSYQFDLEIPLLEWSNQHLPYDYRALNVDRDALLRSAGPIQSGESRFDDTPTFFLGYGKIGFELWSETNLNWSRIRGYQPIASRRNPKATRFEVAPVNAPRASSGPDTPFTPQWETRSASI